ncbi:carbohydrate-binding module family 50 protein [Lentithecium fluviatile CBS 122367]|uniref:Carbohydrate-binding module family 50 protein n=1 Tax=Lentithecium fluviatile CBS 122367 TaxID=1168545 RepID=A0A6G1IHF6_9PLEO|nr:carbohydrate-binding module family 50 protein [Lentithecium fluviatile CBS 122367]
MLSSQFNVLLIGGIFKALAVEATQLVARDGPSPSLPTDTNTSKYCSWWVDLRSETSCPTFLEDNFITLEEFRRWNPSITADCNLITGKSYCVEAVNEPVPTLTTTVQTSTTSKTSTSTLTTSSTSKPVVTTTPTTIKTTPTTTPPPTSTKPSNGIETPSPLQSSIVANCDKFYFVQQDDNCDSISKSQGISSAQIIAWNPSVGSSCAGLWANAYACVSIIGHEPSTALPTTTAPSNGIATPTPIQDGMVSNCDSFYKVKDKDTCDSIARSNGILTSQITKWNPTVGSSCSSLWLDYYICISTVGHTPTFTTVEPTKTTKPSNGVATPTPIQTGMTTSCKTFHFVAKDENCQTIVAKYKITLANFVKWNPAVGGTGCKGLWSNTYACVGVL